MATIKELLEKIKANQVNKTIDGEDNSEVTSKEKFNKVMDMLRGKPKEPLTISTTDTSKVEGEPFTPEVIIPEVITPKIVTPKPEEEDKKSVVIDWLKTHGRDLAAMVPTALAPDDYKVGWLQEQDAKRQELMNKNRTEPLTQYDNLRNEKLQHEVDLYKPDSEATKDIRDAAKKAHPGGDWDGMSGYAIMQTMDDQYKKESMANDDKKFWANYNQKLAIFDKGLQERVNVTLESAKSAVDESLKLVNEMTDLYNSGEKPQNIVSQEINPNIWTASVDAWMQTLPRLLSGAAIGEKEKQEFKKLLPGYFDSEKVAQWKFNRMRDILTKRASSLDKEFAGVSSNTPSKTTENKSFTPYKLINKSSGQVADVKTIEDEALLRNNGVERGKNGWK